MITEMPKVTSSGGNSPPLSVWFSKPRWMA